jgi:hypothetical protein
VTQARSLHGWTRRSLVARVAGLTALLVWSENARAGGTLGANGTKLNTSSYAIDLYQGPVFAGSRVTGLAGAYVALAEDVDGDLQNPAAPAVRPFYSYTDFDYWLGFGLTFPSTLNDVDFFNSGSQTKLTNSPDSFVFFVPALNLQWGEFGLGLTVELSHYQLSSQLPAEQAPTQMGTASAGTEANAIVATIPTFHLQIAHGFVHNQWVFGMGSRLVRFAIDSSKDRKFEFASNGIGLELGALYKPEALPLRIGLAFRSAIRTQPNFTAQLLPNPSGDILINDQNGNALFMPESVAQPWDLNVGVAVQLGRPLNPPWRTSSELSELALLRHRLAQIERERRLTAALQTTTTAAEREALERSSAAEQAADDVTLDRELLAAREETEQRLAELNRRYLLISASLLVSGSVDQAIGVESFVSQVVNRSGQHTVYSPRLGLETAVLPELLKLRAGTYLEPTRFASSSPRVHGTFGLDLRLVSWNVFGLWPNDYVWRLGLGGDASRRYFSWGLTLGGWYPRRRDAAE